MTSVQPPRGVVRVERTGWLRKRAHFTPWWRPTWVHLSGGQLRYGEQEQKPVKTILLVGAEVQTTEDPLGWTITPKDKKRCYHLRAASGAEHASWTRDLLEARTGSSSQHGAHTCVLQ